MIPVINKPSCITKNTATAIDHASRKSSPRKSPPRKTTPWKYPYLQPLIDKSPSVLILHVGTNNAPTFKFPKQND